LPPASADLHVGRRAIRTNPNAFSLCEKRKKEKQFHEKEFPENVVASRNVVCNRRAARQAQFVKTLASLLQLDHTTVHKSCHLLLLICMSFDAQSAPTQTRSLFVRKEKRKKNSQKRIHKKELSENVVERRLQSTCSTTSAVRCKAGIPVAAHTYNQPQVLPPASADLHASRHAICTKRNAFALCEKKMGNK
jgi:hypothetical protein